MSKSGDSNAQKSLTSMSSRQQLLYIMNKSKNGENEEEAEEKVEEKKNQFVILDYHKYFLEKKERIVNFIFNLN
jgi:hypothetical protein